MKIDHAPTPQLCKACSEAFSQQVAERAGTTQSSALIYFCEHNMSCYQCLVDPPGRITSWMMDRPVSKQEAERRREFLLAKLRTGTPARH